MKFEVCIFDRIRVITLPNALIYVCKYTVISFNGGEKNPPTTSMGPLFFDCSNWFIEGFMMVKILRFQTSISDAHGCETLS